MKKIFKVLIAFVLVLAMFAFAACGNINNNQTESPTTSGSPSPTTPTEETVNFEASQALLTSSTASIMAKINAAMVTEKIGFAFNLGVKFNKFETDKEPDFPEGTVLGLNIDGLQVDTSFETTVPVKLSGNVSIPGFFVNESLTENIDIPIYLDGDSLFLSNDLGEETAYTKIVMQPIVELLMGMMGGAPDQGQEIPGVMDALKLANLTTGAPDGSVEEPAGPVEDIAMILELLKTFAARIDFDNCFNIIKYVDGTNTTLTYEIDIEKLNGIIDEVFGVAQNMMLEVKNEWEKLEEGSTVDDLLVAHEEYIALISLIRTFISSGGGEDADAQIISFLNDTEANIKKMFTDTQAEAVAQIVPDKFNVKVKFNIKNGVLSGVEVLADIEGLIVGTHTIINNESTTIKEIKSDINMEITFNFEVLDEATITPMEIGEDTYVQDITENVIGMLEEMFGGKETPPPTVVPGPIL